MSEIGSGDRILEFLPAQPPFWTFARPVDGPGETSRPERGSRPASAAFAPGGSSDLRLSWFPKNELESFPDRIEAPIQEVA